MFRLKLRQLSNVFVPNERWQQTTTVCIINRSLKCYFYQNKRQSEFVMKKKFEKKLGKKN
jgi:hypothetical protein